jgi:hypothetical protein
VPEEPVDPSRDVRRFVRRGSPQRIILGRTTRADLHGALGHPGAVSKDRRFASYFSNTVNAKAFVWGPVEKCYQLLVEFDERDVVRRYPLERDGMYTIGAKWAGQAWIEFTNAAPLDSFASPDIHPDDIHVDVPGLR